MNQQVNFDRYCFEPRTARLRADEREIRLTPKAAAVLGMLVARAGHPVTKEELFSAVWANRVVSDDALTTCIQELRKALGDDARSPRYIETRHRSGYRFVAPLSAPDDAEVATADAAAIGVLPFMDMSPARDQDFFCEGLAEELIDALTHIDGLRVAARSASFQFRGPGLDVRDVARRLGVGALLEGSVRKDGDQLRVTVQLIDAASGYHTWSQRFERTLGDVFAIQDEIAETVATTLRGSALSRRERTALRRRQTAAESYEYYLRGRQCLHRLLQPDLERSREMFERSLGLDEDYAPAWAGLATAHALLFEWWGGREEDLGDADRASRIALELSPDLADAHVARACVLSQHRRYDEAETHFETATRINPNLFDAWYYHARTSFARGNVERSVDLYRQAARAQPDDFQSPILLSQSLRLLGRGAEASAARREGIARAERILRLNPLDARALSLGAGALYEDGQTQRAMEWSQRSLQLHPDDMGVLFNAACLRGRSGVKDETLEILERIFSHGWGKRDWIDRDPDFDCVREDPRFQRMLQKLK